MNRILLVDDKEENLYYLRVLLEGNGFDIETAFNGEEALVHARREAPDLVVSDLLMPVMDGYTLLRKWKCDATLSDVPFVVYTATYTEAEDERLALDSGADAFILKPCEPEAFLSRIHKVIDAAATRPPTPPREPADDEKILLQSYSETLVRKLEARTEQLEKANRALQLDIEARKAVEASLRDSERNNREKAALLDQTQDAILVTDLNDRILYWNQAAIHIYGWTVDEATGRTARELLHGGKPTPDETMRTLLDKGTWRGELQQSTKDGTPVDIDGRWTLLRNDNGEPIHVLAVHTDITSRKEYEARFLRTQRMESIGMLAGGIAHDINNLLAPIIMGVDILNQRPWSENEKVVLDTIEASARRGTDLVKQVLSFARGVEGSRIELELDMTLKEIESIIANTFPKNIRFQIEVDQGLWPVVGDPTQINQVLLNLCVNARDAMPDGGCLTLGAHNAVIDEHDDPGVAPGVKAGCYVALEVADDGCGIAPDVMERIFEPFFTTKEYGRGTGLGLSTACGIVRSHGGFLNVCSEPGKGCVFKIHLPACIGGEAGEDAPVTPVESLPRGDGQTILVVDDEGAILSIAKQTLEAFGYNVFVATDGARAARLYSERRDEIDLVLTDMLMPGMDGTALIAALRDINPDVRIIAASGLNQRQQGGALEKTDVGYFLPKPYTAERLLRILREALAAEPGVVTHNGKSPPSLRNRSKAR